MKQLLALLLLLSTLIACSQPKSEKDKLTDRIRSLEKKLATQESDTLDMATAGELVKLSESFAITYPDDSLAVIFLFRAADVARGIGEYAQAVQLWRKVHRDYNETGKAPEALFLLAFTFDKDLNNTAQAIRHYKAFLEEYPEHPLAKDASLLLQYLEAGKSPEELIKEFESQSRRG